MHVDHLPSPLPRHHTHTHITAATTPNSTSFPPQGEPELERLKRELEELKHAPRSVEGSFRSQADMDRHRAQLADAAIEEQLEVQTALREQGSKLTTLYEKKQRLELEISKR